MNLHKPHIYRRRIIATGKYYIGKHKGGDKYYKGSGVEWKKDLKLYKDYDTEVLEYVEDISLLNEREEYWLNKFDASNNKLYYNKTNHAFGPMKQSLEWKKAQSDRMRGKSTTQGKSWKVKDTSNMKGGGFKGKKHSEETIKKMKGNKSRNEAISKSLKGRDISLWKEKIHTEERNNKISKTKGEGILQFDLNNKLIKEWNSYNDARNGGFPSIQRAIKINKPYKGYMWMRKKDYQNNN